MSRLDAQFRIDYPGFCFDVACTVPLDGTIAVFGSSGSGKTTLLRCIAGLTRAPSGFLQFDQTVGRTTLTGFFYRSSSDAWGSCFKRHGCFRISL